MKIVEEIKERLSIFKNLYDIVRIVDPFEKKSLIIDNNDEINLEDFCYEFWRRDLACENCVCMRAYLNNDTFVKVEHSGEKTFLITASPVTFDEKTYVAELLKDITTSGNIIYSKNGEKDIKTLISEMNEKIITDELTKVYNRRYINERLPVDINDSITNGKVLSIILADIDFFKNINDNYGHLIGDKVLQDFAKILSCSIKKDTSWVARYGGEEFLIVLNNNESEDGYEVAERIRKLLNKTTFIYDDTKINLTCSFGVYGLKNKKMNIDELISKADKNLYEAKLSGRNKTVSN